MLRKEQLGKHGSQVSDDEPLYDSVASDDDYAALTSTDNTVSDASNQLKANKEVIQFSNLKLFFILQVQIYTLANAIVFFKFRINPEHLYCTEWRYFI